MGLMCYQVKHQPGHHFLLILCLFLLLSLLQLLTIATSMITLCLCFYFLTFHDYSSGAASQRKTNLLKALTYHCHTKLEDRPQRAESKSLDWVTSPVQIIPWANSSGVFLLLTNLHCPLFLSHSSKSLYLPFLLGYTTVWHDLISA